MIFWSVFAFCWAAKTELPHCWFSNISLLSFAEDPGTSIQMHLENNAFIYPSELSGAMIQETQTLGLHPMCLNFKCVL